MNEYMVIDVGGTFIKYAVMDEQAIKLQSGKIPTPEEGLDAFLREITDIVNKAREDHDIKGIALSCPGAVDVNTGYIGGASAIPYIHGVDIPGLLTATTNLPISIENDANCAALAEGWLGAAKENRYYVCMVIGTGIGGSIVIDQAILRGATLHGGEFGYMVLENPLTDPLQSTWSLSASTNALVRSVEEKKSLSKGTLDGEAVFSLAEKGDPIAKGCITNMYKKLAVCAYNLKYALDPEKILIGGGISKRPEVIEGINRELACLKNEISTLDIEVQACHFDNDANLIGALFHFLKHREGKFGSTTSNL